MSAVLQHSTTPHLHRSQSSTAVSKDSHSLSLYFDTCTIDPAKPSSLLADSIALPNSSEAKDRSNEFPSAFSQFKPKLKTSQTWHHTGNSGGSSCSSRTSSPSGLEPQRSFSIIQPISLSPPVISTTNNTHSSASNSMNENSNSSGQKTSLMRRVSQKAADRLRRRTSSTSHEGERSGPVVMRHRSGSASGSGGEPGWLGIQHHDSLDDDEDTVLVMDDQLDGPPSTNTGQKARPLTSSSAQERMKPDTSVGITVPEELQAGTSMTRVTRKKRTKRLFVLDVNNARVSWDPTKPTSRFYVDDMKEIRTGANARNYREELCISSDLEDRWMTIIFVDPQDNGKLKTLHIIAPSIDLFQVWTSTLESIHRYRTEMMAGLAMQGEKFVDAHWRNYMATRQAANPKDERLSFEDVERLCRRLHVNCSRRLLREKFRRSDRDNSGYLNFQEFQRFVKLLKEREEIKRMWEEVVANPDQGMTKAEFVSFLKDIQKVDVETDHVQVDKVFRKFCRQTAKMQNMDAGASNRQEDGQDNYLSREAFASFLLSSYNPSLLGSTGEQNLDRPLNEYFCSSSHNTYLMGRQVRGESSVEGYIRVLQRGCRCVEIDCWDGYDGRPVVTHGHTGTSECLFSDVISAIGKYAFLASPYPVILSLEVHCSLEQQVKMAEILTSILGDKLVTEQLMQGKFTLPSPQELKHRILVKVKGDDRKEQMGEHFIDKKTGISSFRRGGGFIKNSTYSSSATSESEDPSSGSRDSNKKTKVTLKIAHELGSLGVYYRGQKFRNFALPESKTFNHVFSFQEKAFLKFCKDPEKKSQLEKHNVRYLLRVYPSGFRVNSSNFDPLGFWRRGVQMVALNWQTYDIGVQLNEAMFASGSDRSGYVLKPMALRGSKAMFDSDTKLKKPEKHVRFSIEVISAQQLPRAKEQRLDESINPFVEVEVFSADDKTKGVSTGEGGIDLSDSKGVSGIGAPQKRRTAVVWDDGFHPLFREKMTFSLVTKFEDLIFVRFSVYNSDVGDDKSLIATYTAKLCSMQQGYRHLPLFDVQGEQYLFSTLFVRVDIDPMTLIDPEVTLRSSTLESFKSTAMSVLSRGFSSDRRSVKRKNSIDTSATSDAPLENRKTVNGYSSDLI